MKVTYIVEKNCKTVKKFKNEMDAINYANEINGVAWEHQVWKDQFGTPCNRFMKYDKWLDMWVNQ